MARIIYAEDEELTGELVQFVLLEAGHAVGVVKSGEEALSLVRARRPDLLILDINMPGITGVQALEAIRRDPQLYDLPVLMLTGRSSASDETIAIRAGATDYLRKPVDPDELTYAVNELVGRHRDGGGSSKPPARPA